MFNKAKTDKKYRNMLIMLLVVFIFCIPSYAVFMTSFTEIYEAFQSIGLQSLFIIMAIIASIFFIVFFGMFQIISYFYFSNDVKILTPLPIKPSYYLISKFFVIYIWELIFSIFIILPFFIIYGAYENIYIYQWIAMLISFILLPIIPLVIAAILTILMMSLTNVFKSKDALRMVGYMLLLIGVFAFQYFMFKTLMPDDLQGQMNVFQKLAENSSYFLEQFSLYYPVTIFVNYSITGSFVEAMFSVILFLIVALGFVYLLSIVLQSMFINSYLKEQNSPSKKKKINKQNIGKKHGVGNVGLSIAKIDFITLLKVPIYAFNSLAIVVLVPVLFIISSTVMQNSSDMEGLNQLLAVYGQYKNEFWLGFTLFLTVSSALMPIATTTFSREGKTNWIMRTLPISPRDHILGRIYTPFFTQVVFNIIMTILLVITLARRGIPIQEIIIYAVSAVVISLIASLPLLFLGVYVDLKRPMLKWDNPQQPVKQNMNVLISMGLGIGYASIVFILYRFVFSKFLPLYMMFVLFFIIGIILSLLTYRLLEKQFNKSLVVMD